MNPGFSRLSALEESIINVPTYHGTTKMKPNINLGKRKKNVKWFMQTNMDKEIKDIR